ncbi:MAG: GxxExxY protein [Bacteroidota bacterium]
MSEFHFKDLTYELIGAAMEVHNQLGAGFMEGVYSEALGIEFQLREIPFLREKRFLVQYKGIQLRKDFYADFLVYDKIILELKALPCLTGEHEAQLMNYLYASKLKVGLLLNFGEKSLRYKRLII